MGGRPLVSRLRVAVIGLAAGTVYGLEWRLSPSVRGTGDVRGRALRPSKAGGSSLQPGNRPD